MADVVQIRRDTAAAWASANPILANGEQGYETDTRKTKVGDGATTWNLLDYTVGGSGEANTASNSGAGAGLAQTKSGVNLPFKSLTAGANVTLTPNANDVEIAASGGGGSSTWLGLTDTPGSFNALQLVRANSTPNALEFVNPNTLDVAKVGGCDPGVATTNVFKIPGSLARGDIFYINASGNLVRLPAGASGRFLKTLGTAGDPAWADMGTAAGIFEEATNVIREKSAGGYNNDFVFGSPRLADDGNSAHDSRMWFNKSKGAFRAGNVDSTQWDDANVGNYSHAIGWKTKASGSESHAEGHATIASGTCAHVEGCVSEAQGYDSHAEGWSCIASADYTHAEGGQADAYLVGMHAKANTAFSTRGDSQLSNLVARAATTGASQKELKIYNTPALPLRMILPANRTWAFDIRIAARQTAGAGTVGDSAGYEIKGVIKRDGANNTALVGSITKTTIAEDQAAWDVTAEADDTNEALVVKVTGEASKTIHWVAAVYLTEVG